MLRGLVRCCSNKFTRIVVQTVFTTPKMRRSRYFTNPYCQEDETSAADFLDNDEELKSLKEDLRVTIDKIVKKEPPNKANPEGGLYVGSAGIAYAFLHVSLQLSSTAKDPSINEYISLAQRYMENALCEIQKHKHVDSGFLLGDSGVIAVAAVLANINNDHESLDAFAKRYVGMADICKSVNFLRHGSDEFFIGRAGYLYGSMWLNKMIGKIVVPVQLMHEISHVIVLSGKNYSQKHSSPCPLMYGYHGTEYFGAAHGISAILQVLIQVPGYLATSKETESLVRTSVDYLLSLETSSGNYPTALDEIDAEGRVMRDETDALVHWCHGSPGIIYLMATAYLHWKDQRYLDACQRAGELVWQKGLLKKGPGICHGVAGSGYVFLLLYRLTSDRRHLGRAKKFAYFLNTDEFKKGSKTPDSPYSLFEGISGTACFLADLLKPDTSSFPFQNVFLA